MGCGTILLLGVLSLVFGQDFFQLVGGMDGGQSPTSPAPQQYQQPGSLADDPEQAMVEFIGYQLDDIQAVWQQLLPQLGQRYEETTLVLFRDFDRSGCGYAQAASGPFYCPADRKVYIDLVFYRELSDRFRAPGDFAQAYVLAHEIGHHVQTLLGISDQVRRAKQRASKREANQIQVAMELQADCYAGVWGHSAAQRGKLERGDLDEGLRAAGSIGDDRIARMSGRSIHPDAFTHGSAEHRISWFRRGLENGDPRVCDTFGG